MPESDKGTKAGSAKTDSAMKGTETAPAATGGIRNYTWDELYKKLGVHPDDMKQGSIESSPNMTPPSTAPSSKSKPKR